ncbi:MSMEG_0568 family radical SAM protein [Pseudonocardia broussonetiae]|uniref:MSMEG_0568 family radical SAM protein n=1 Tax=Pseudonocardia broussonetiae TaxID=2736640 RepID=A0A6M6JG72_9PSEU|nr:MSMEG_0568 family radical SAM protein [Pseudonocardia broussonetiae]QJY46133.1 MSMEG_0568 family radical SAM protein [Pseudonocardia broussonetiae]
MTDVLNGAPPRPEGAADPAAVAALIMDLQAVGLRIDTELATSRTGGAGPSDSGMLWVEGVPVTVPPSTTSPYRLLADDEGQSIYRDGRKVASVSGTDRPRFYDLQTADGVPYHQIALLHLDSLASTVVQACNYWGNADQCGFCGIGLSLAAGRTVAKKTPEMLAEVAVAAKELDGAVDATLTTGSSVAPDRGALYVARCGQAVKEASGLPVEVQFEPPRDLSVLDRVHDMGIDSVGVHVESFDPAVLARVAPGKFRTGIDSYFRTWERAVALFGEGRVSTYVILGMGEDPDLTVAMCKRAVDIGVYPFVVPFRPVAGSLMQDVPAPSREYTEPIYRKVAAFLAERGLGADTAVAGCARCQACSSLNLVQQAGAAPPCGPSGGVGGVGGGPTLLQIGSRP